MNSNKKIILRRVLKYVRSEINKDNYPSYKQINEKFNISYHKITLKDVYTKIGINILNFPFKRPNSFSEELRNNLIKYIKKEVKKGHYPSRRYIEKNFKLRLTPNLFDSIEDLYQKSDLRYIQKNSQELKNKKAKILTKIIVSILPKMK